MNREKFKFVFDEIKHGTRRVHSAPSRPGIDQTGSMFPLIVPDMRVPRKKIIVLIRIRRRLKGVRIITMQKGDLFTGQLELPKTPENLDADILGIKVPALCQIAVAEDNIESNFQGLEKSGHFGEHHIVTDVATMKNRLNPAKNEFAGRT